MAKPNRAKKSYFDINIQQNGEDFLSRKTVEEIQRDAKRRIFRDMAYGNIDYSKHGHYFTEPVFLEQLIIVSANEMVNHQIKFSALYQYDINNPGDPKVIQLLNEESRLASAMMCIHGALSAVKEYGYNIGYLTDVATAVWSYRKDIANNY